MALVAGGASNYAYSVSLGWLLSPEKYGVVAFVQALVVILSFPLAYGIPASLVVQGGQTPIDDVRRRFFGALLANSILGIVLAVGCVVAYLAGPFHAGFQQFDIAVIAALALPGIAAIATFLAVAQAGLNFGYVGVILTSEILGKAILGIALVSIGWGASGAIAGLAVGSLIGTIVGAAVVFGRMRFRPRRVVEWPHARLSTGLFLAQFGGILLFSVDLLAVKLLVGQRAAAGQYQAALLLTNATYYLLIGALEPVIVGRVARRESLEAARDRLLVRVAGSRHLSAACAGGAGRRARRLHQAVLPGQLPRCGAADAHTGDRQHPAAARRPPRCSTPRLSTTVTRSDGRRPCVIGEIVVLALAVPSGGSHAAALTFLGACCVAAAAMLVALLRTELGRAMLRPPEIFPWLSRWLATAGIAVVVGVIARSLGASAAEFLCAGALGYCLLGLSTGIFKTSLISPLETELSLAS